MVLPMLNYGQTIRNKLFTIDETLEISIRFNKEVWKDIDEDRKFHPAVLVYKEDGTEMEIPIEVKTRGNFRRSKKNCDYPPLTLQFKPKAVKRTPFDGISELKLVTHCKDWDEFEIYLQREFMVYRLMNILTEESLKVRWLQITYEHNDDNPQRVRSGFLIEDEKLMADRINATRIKSARILENKSAFSPDPFISLFQFMIGNTDWSVPHQHNVVTMVRNYTGDTVSVGYDFDHSGFVNAHYAQPYPPFEMSSVKDRYYVGRCLTNESLKENLKVFRDYKTQIEKYIDDYKELDSRQKKSLSKFVDSFYKAIRSEKLTREILNTCGKNY